MYEKFLERLKEIREYEWNDYDVKIYGEVIEDEFCVITKGFNSC